MDATLYFPPRAPSLLRVDSREACLAASCSSVGTSPGLYMPSWLSRWSFCISRYLLLLATNLACTWFNVSTWFLSASFWARILNSSASVSFAGSAPIRTPAGVPELEAPNWVLSTSRSFSPSLFFCYSSSSFWSRSRRRRSFLFTYSM